MKKNLGYIIMFIFGLITAGSIGVAAYNYNANNIEYSPSDKTWKVSTVAEAINSLVNDTRTSFMKYSLDEQVVGEWIDGKPIYQKTIVSNSYGGGVHTIYSNVVSELNIDKVADLHAVLHNSASNSDFFTISNNMGANDAVYVSAGNLIFKKDSTSSSWYVVVTIQYTKTTDTGNNNNS